MANGHGVHDDEHGGSLGSGGSLRSQKLKESFREKLKELKEHAHLPHMHLSNLSLKRSSHQEPAHMSHEGTPRRGKRKQLKKGRKSNDMNDWGMTFDEEMEVLNEFQDELKGEEGVRKDHLIDEKKLLRFLKARNFDIDKAKEMFLKHLKWREGWDVDNILFQEFPEREQLLQYFPQGYHMCDKQGRPIYIQYLGGINIHKILSFTDEETIVKLFIQEYEKFQHYKLPACSEAQGKLIETSLNIMDVSGISLKILTKESQRIMKKVTGFTQDNYPEMMGNTVIINAPYIFKVIFNIVKPMLSARTQSKITMVGTRYLDKLLEFADISCLPKRLGGTSEFTIFDDVGPWTRIAPSISSKHQLDLYQSQQMSRWNRSGAEGKSPAAEISLRAIPSTSSFYSETEEVSADYFFTSREGGGDGIDVAEKRRGKSLFFPSSSFVSPSFLLTLRISGPNLLSWVQALEKDVEDLCRDYSVGESSQRKVSLFVAVPFSCHPTCD